MKFQVYKEGKLVEKFDLAGAYIFGPDRTPLRDSENVTFENGTISCSGDGFEAAGLSVLWPINGYGSIMMPTTRLRKRPRPYILNLELARSRMMQIIIKREDWAFFDEDNTVSKVAHEVQDLYIKAVENINDPVKASILADKCLKNAVIFSEKMAEKYASAILSIRKKNNALGRTTLGCTVDNLSIGDDTYRKRVLDLFGYITIPVNWANIEKERGVYNFSEIDNAIQKLAGQKILIAAGPLLKFSPEFLPEWLLNSEHSFEKLQEACYDFVTKIVSRYSNYVKVWNVISGVNCFNHFDFTFEQVLEITRSACIASRSADNRSKKVIEVSMLWGEYYAKNTKTVPPLVYVDMVVQSGINFDAFGIELKFGKNDHGYFLRDMMQISSRLDCFLAVPKPVHITGIEIPGVCESELGLDSGGTWKGKWCESNQSLWIERLYKILLGKPFIGTVTYGKLCDSHSNYIAKSGLINSELGVKKSYLSVGKLQKYVLSKGA